MNLFTFISLAIFSVAAVCSLVVSVLAFCGNERFITEKGRQRYHVKSFRLHTGFFYLGYSLFAAAVAYLTFIGVSWSMVITLIFLVYSIAGPIYLSKSKHLVKDPSVVIDITEMSDTQLKVQGSLMLGLYIGLPVLIIIGALLLY